MPYIIIVAMLFQAVLAKYLGFSYLDEIVSLLFFLYFISKGITKKKFNKNDLITFKMFFVICAFYIVGTISTSVYNYQNNIVYGMISGLFSIKAFLTFLGAKLYFSEYHFTRKNIRILLYTVEGSLIVSAILLTLNHFINIFGYFGYKMGIPTTAYIFNHPTEVASYAILSLVLSIYLRDYLGYQKKFFRNYIPSFFIILAAINFKALGFLILLITIGFILPFIKKFKIWHLIMGIPFVVLMTYEQLIYYFTDITSSRGALFYYSFFIARDHFPFGSGFGTYGTEYSRKVYSPLYYKYGMDKIYGLAPSNPMYVTDTMWPPILAETGLIGALLILVFFWYLIKLVRENKNGKKATMLQYLVIAYGLIESIGDSIFMNARGVTIFLMLALFMALEKNVNSFEGDKNEKNINIHV